MAAKIQMLCIGILLLVRIVPTNVDVTTTTSPNSSMSPTHIFISDTATENHITSTTKMSISTCTTPNYMVTGTRTDERVTSSNVKCTDVSILASSAAILCVLISLALGVPTLLLGMLGGIHYQKMKLKPPRNSLPQENNNLVSSITQAGLTIPVYEEIKDKQIELELKRNIAYEQIQI